jgi:HlyD family secretion protein
MRFPVKTAIVLVGLGALGAVSYSPMREYWKNRSRPHFRQAEITRGPITSVVNSTGTVKPVLSVSVGAFVSGPIESLHVDFNDEVKKNDLLAKIDPRIYDAAVARDKATLATRKADVRRVKALLQHATNDENRAKKLRAEKHDYLSDTEMDKFMFARLSLEAELIVAESNVEQAQANLNNSLANLGYTEIRSPVDGIVIERKIEPGQTLATQFQMPELFVVAPDMRKTMHVFASVDEADIGLIRDAQLQKQPVRFTVDAYPDDLFEGEIHQIRTNSTTTQNVVTYPVIVAAANPDLKLLPGMTASLSFQTAETKDVLRVPNAALRYYPLREHVRPEDRALLEGNDRKDTDKEDGDSTSARQSATEKAEARRSRSHRHVWVVDGEHLKAIEITTGLSDNKHTAVVSGDLRVGQNVVTGIQTTP